MENESMRNSKGKRSIVLCVVVITFLLSAVNLHAGDGGRSEGASSLKEAFTSGKFSLNLNYRFEFVDDASFDDDGRASTLRTTMGYKSQQWQGIGVFLEIENVTDLGMGNDHNNKGWDHLWNGVSDRPVVADPEITAVNQAYLNFDFIPNTTLQAGRREIMLGDVRFVGNVGWRQHHQSFDSVYLGTTALPNTKITYVYADKVNRIFGDSKDMGSHLFEADINLGKGGTLSAYAFLLDYDKQADVGLSTSTYGLRYFGSYNLSDTVNGLWDFAVADQSDYGDNPNTVDALYWRAEVGAKFSDWTFKVGREVLGGSPKDGKFTTPLATLHKWNGWADQFLATPANGLVDSTLIVATAIKKVKLTAVYHVFEADTGSADYGTELDLLAVYVTDWKQKFGLKVAMYDADQYKTDTTKLMLWTSWGF